MQEGRAKAGGVIPAGWVSEADKVLARLREHTLAASNRAVDEAVAEWASEDAGFTLGVLAAGLTLLGVGALFYGLSVWLPDLRPSVSFLPDLGGLSGVMRTLAVVAGMVSGPVVGFGLALLASKRVRRAKAVEAASIEWDERSRRAFFVKYVLPHPELVEIAALWLGRGIPLRAHEEDLLRQGQAALEGRTEEMRLVQAGLYPGAAPAGGDMAHQSAPGA